MTVDESLQRSKYFAGRRTRPVDLSGVDPHSFPLSLHPGAEGPRLNDVG